MKKIAAAVIVIVFSLSFFLTWWNTYTHYSFDRDTGVLEVSGELSRDFFYNFMDRDEVKSIVATKGCRMPMDCKGLLSSINHFMPKLESVDLSKADFSRVKNAREMFYHCECIKSIDLSGVDAPKLIDMQGMFMDCHYLTFVDMTGFNAPNVRDVTDLFFDCSNLRTVDLGWLDFSKEPDASCMFANCRWVEPDNLNGIDISKLKNLRDDVYA